MGVAGGEVNMLLILIVSHSFWIYFIFLFAYLFYFPFASIWFSNWRAPFIVEDLFTLRKFFLLKEPFNLGNPDFRKSSKKKNKKILSKKNIHGTPFLRTAEKSINININTYNYKQRQWGRNETDKSRDKSYAWYL